MGTLVFLLVAHLLVVPAVAVARVGVPAGRLGAAMGGGFAVGAVVVGLAAQIPLDGPIGLAVRVGVAATVGVAAIGLDQGAARTTPEPRLAPTQDL